MKKIRVGVIGLGFIGKQHVEALRRLPYIEIVAGSDSNLSMREWCEKNGIQKYYSDYKEMPSGLFSVLHCLILQKRFYQFQFFSQCGE